MNDLKYVSGTMLFVLLFLTYFMSSFSNAVRLSLAILFVWFVPGYVLVNFFIKDMGIIEKIILGFFMGFSLNALLLYYLNVFGVMSISSFFAYLVGFIAFGLIVLEKFFKSKAV